MSMKFKPIIFIFFIILSFFSIPLFLFSQGVILTKGFYVEYTFNPLVIFQTDWGSNEFTGVFQKVYEYTEGVKSYKMSLRYEVEDVTIDYLEIKSTMTVYDVNGERIDDFSKTFMVYRRSNVIKLGDGELIFPVFLNVESLKDVFSEQKLYFNSTRINITINQVRNVGEANYPFSDWIYDAVVYEFIYSVDIKFVGNYTSNIDSSSTCVIDVNSGIPFTCTNAILPEYLYDNVLIIGSLNMSETNVELSSISPLSIEGLTYIYNSIFFKLLEINHILAFIFFLSPFLLLFTILYIIYRIKRYISR